MKPLALDDGINRVTTDFPFTPATVEATKTQYYNLLGDLEQINPGVDRYDLITKILQAEERNNYKFFGRRTSTNGSTDMLETYEKRRLRAYKEINFINPDEQTRLDILEEKFSSVYKYIVESTSLERDFVVQSVNELLQFRVVSTLTEAADVIIYGPQIQGFDLTKDPVIPNKEITEFLITTFGLEALRIAKLGRVAKDDKYMLLIPKIDGFESKANKIIQEGWMVYDDSSFLITESEDDFFKAEMIFEDGSSLTSLRHLYKVRADDGNPRGYALIRLRSFGVEKMEDFDYLSDLNLSEKDKMRAYILGTIAHKVAHRYEQQLSFQGLADVYLQIIDTEASEKRTRYVSDYVLRHEKVYNTNLFTILREDFAETVRIYVTNPNYLEKYYPQRFSFIQTHFPFIKPNGVIYLLATINN